MINMKKAVEFGTQLPAALGVLYTCPAGSTVMLKRVTLLNGNTINEVVVFSLVPSGGSAGPEHVFILKTLTPSETYTVIDLEGHVMAPGDTLQALSITADKVNVFASVLEQT